MKINKDLVDKAIDCLGEFVAPKQDSDLVKSIFDQIKDVLLDYKVKVDKSNFEIHNYFVRYYFSSDNENMLKKSLKFIDDVKLRLKCLSVRAYLKNGYVCFEVVNPQKSQVGLKELLGQSIENEKESGCYCVIGKMDGKTLNCDITKMPHLLIAGATASGKSVLIHEIIVSLISRYSPNELKLLLIDPKGVEFNVYNDVPHVVNGKSIMSDNEIISAFEALIEEMDKRYDSFEKYSVVNIDDYNKYAQNNNIDLMRKIVVVIDEFADLMEGHKNEFERLVRDLTSKCRAAGIYLIFSTQRPSKDTVTTAINACLPSRIACKLMYSLDSKLIIGAEGAEQLIGWGDLLYKDVTMIEPVRALAGYISGKEIREIVSIVKEYYNNI